ncbi:hypothetical protein [Eubacterium ventriosum]|uniref:hypothetical protein n=1 Tax=Eubacterium ventriosum TaxID=39496 RepID=UPI003AB2B898
MEKEITVRGKNQNYTDYEKFIKKKKRLYNVSIAFSVIFEAVFLLALDGTFIDPDEDFVSTLIMSIVGVAACIFWFIKMVLLKNDIRLFKKCVSIINSDEVSISELANTIGVEPEKLKKKVRKFVNRSWIVKCYIDEKENKLIFNINYTIPNKVTETQQNKVGFTNNQDDENLQKNVTENIQNENVVASDTLSDDKRADGTNNKNVEIKKVKDGSNKKQNIEGEKKKEAENKGNGMNIFKWIILPIMIIISEFFLFDYVNFFILLIIFIICAIWIYTGVNCLDKTCPKCRNWGGLSQINKELINTKDITIKKVVEDEVRSGNDRFAPRPEKVIRRTIYVPGIQYTYNVIYRCPKCGYIEERTEYKKVER